MTDQAKAMQATGSGHAVAAGGRKAARRLPAWAMWGLTAAALLVAMATSAAAQQTSAPVTDDSSAQREAQQTAAEAQRSPRRIVVSIPDRMLALLDGDRVLKTFAIAVGADASPSPSGEFTIINRVTNPTYYKPGKVIPPGRANPLGTRWMGLSKPSFGIHGTNEPQSIGKAASAGCVRMRNRDVEKLFELVRVGDVVVIRAERDAEIARLFEQPEPSASDATVAAGGY